MCVGGSIVIHLHVHVHIQVTKKHVDNYKPGRRIPRCQLSARFTSEIQVVTPLEHQVRLLGAKEPYDMFAIILAPFGTFSSLSVCRKLCTKKYCTLTCTSRAVCCRGAFRRAEGVIRSFWTNLCP